MQRKAVWDWQFDQYLHEFTDITHPARASPDEDAGIPLNVSCETELRLQYKYTNLGLLLLWVQVEKQQSDIRAELKALGGFGIAETNADR